MIQNKIFSSVGRYIFPVVIFIILSISGSGQNNKQDLSGVRKYNSLMQMIKFAYVDSVNESKLVEKAIVETLKELDQKQNQLAPCVRALQDCPED